MTAKEYLEISERAYSEYHKMHGHDDSCITCYHARVAAQVASNMIRDTDYPDNLHECILLYHDNVAFIMENE